MLGICGPDTLKVKLLKLSHIGLSKFSSVGPTLGSVELKRLIPFFSFYHSVDFKFDLRFI